MYIIMNRDETKKCVFVCFVKYAGIYLIVGPSVRLSVCLLAPNIFLLKSERHETRHVGPLGTLKCLRPNGFLNFDLKV